MQFFINSKSFFLNAKSTSTKNDSQAKDRWICDWNMILVDPSWSRDSFVLDLCICLCPVAYSRWRRAVRSQCSIWGNFFYCYLFFTLKIYRLWCTTILPTYVASLVYLLPSCDYLLKNECKNFRNLTLCDWTGGHGCLLDNMDQYSPIEGWSTASNSMFRLRLNMSEIDGMWWIDSSRGKIKKNFKGPPHLIMVNVLLYSFVHHIIGAILMTWFHGSSCYTDTYV